ncbi:bifunctional lysylphosphatidylglycerol synthetase/lysine--tRNA ligase LysX [Williamsia sp. CHRR-6]|uniref:bifunctional lysylphosphatidylglycerol synthetase/lysine--tRNA ligase LysX n=1 Tax=Williamsia sp. CHRR-6 TaxID=2835871 RepID=UPI001BD9292D|nr:bifunctional lysylphosphatidylglycerol synthetase/lysine--tRNA ligase LysX [Williamsia sp. CHRR-6]MBT0566507.1 bifunctional lysylphosphatidylglycerol synthetase/lysine--tRNA ligase LysX [Williamsia sp. CHRR-6]
MSAATSVDDRRSTPSPHRSTPHRGSPRPRRWWRNDAVAEQIATWAGRLLYISAIVSLLAIPFRHLQFTDHVLDLISLFNIPADPSIFIVLLVFAFGGAVRRRFRAAHSALLVVMGISVVDDVLLLISSYTSPDGKLHGRNGISLTAAMLWFALAVGVVTLLVFAYSRRAFVAHLAPRSVRVALVVLLGGLGISFAVTLALTILFPHRLQGWDEELEWALRSTLGDQAQVGDALLENHSGHHLIYVLAGWMSALALLLAILALYRANRDNDFVDADEELAVRELLLRYGEDDSLGYFATRRDKSVVFSPDGKAAVTFRVVGSVSVASADPIGAVQSWPAAVQAWMRNCRDHSLLGAVLAASEAGAKVYRAAGLRVLAIGDEAIIDVDDFTLRGAAMKPVRQAVNRVTAAGYTTVIRRHGELSPEELDEIERLADAWRGEEVERGFSMALNRVGDPSDGRCLLITALDAHGTIRAFLSFVPWGVRGVSLDLMRRDRSAENGVNEYLVARLIEAAPDLGIRRVSLNFAVFRSVFSGAEREGAGPMTRLLDAVLGFASRFYQLESLYRSNQKYRPEWVPRVMCYHPSLTVMRAAVALGVAEGFLPHLGPKFLVGNKTPDEQPRRTDPDFLAAAATLERDLLLARVPPPRLNDQQRMRRRKLAAISESGVQAYPVAVARTHRVADVLAEQRGVAAGSRTGVQVSISGRVRVLRDLGGVWFAVIEDAGARIQVLSESAIARPGEHERLRRSVDLGDLISVTGEVVGSRSGELSVAVASWAMAGKCLNPLPPLSAEIGDDVRVRDRPLDLITNPAAVELLERRSRGVRALRDTLFAHDFLEVETPMLQTVHGGAAARPFKTHINAYDQELFLRIAPELYLKRLCVSGMGAIFEINRNFRNEGADATHNPEFTALEAYQAYGDYNSMRVLTRELILAMAVAINGEPVAWQPDESGQRTAVRLDGDWPIVTVHAAVSRATGTTITAGTPAAQVAGVARAHGVEVAAGMSAGKLVMELYEALVEKQTRFPTFYCDFPVEVSPLARRHRDDPRLTEQWDLVGFGAELGTAYSELTDPVDQRDRLTAQSMQAAGGDPEAMSLDEDFLHALGYAMPPTGGLGLGVDRLVMMLAGVSIRPTLSFPFVRPQQ